MRTLVTSCHILHFALTDRKIFSCHPSPCSITSVCLYLLSSTASAASMDASRGFPFQWFDGLNDDHRQYSMTRPQFVREPEPVHPRDRYRNSRSYEDPTFDTIDEGMYDQDMPFDDFGMTTTTVCSRI